MKLKNEIEKLNLTRAGFNHAVRFYYYYNNKVVFEKSVVGGDGGYVYIPSQEMIDNFTSNYFQMFIKSMLKSKIISRRPFFLKNCEHLFRSSFSENDNKCFSYKFNSDLLDFSETIIVELKKSNKRKKKFDTDEGVNEEYHIRNLKNLVFDYAKMQDIIENIDVENEIIYPKIREQEMYCVCHKNGKTYYYLGLNILDKLNDDIQFFEFRNKYYLQDVNDFVNTKNEHIKLSYSYSFNKLYNDDFYAKRNSTNRRLDSNITNLSKVFFENDVIKWYGESLKEVDLCNSQPCILAYAMSHPELFKTYFQDNNYILPEISLERDFFKFKDYVESGSLYEMLAKDADISRGKAKNGVFEILFSRETNNSSNKNKIKKVFPTVIKYVDDFKSQNGYKSFSVMLQKLESYLFLDYLLPVLQKNRLTVLTKHDCFICKESDVGKVKNIVSQKLNDIGLYHQFSA